MKILVCGEGSDDIGYRDGASEGVVGTFVRRLLSQTQDGLELATLRLAHLPADRSRASGEGRKVSQAIGEALRRDADGLVFARDADHDGPRRRAALEEALRNPDLPTVLSLAVETIESWLLADRSALSAEMRIPETSIPLRPEELWGAPGTAGHPKREWNEVCRTANWDHGGSTKLRIAEIASVSALRTACPLGFGEFHRALERAFPVFDVVIAADQSGGIADAGGTPWPRLESHNEIFERLTGGTSGAVIMGRRTWESRDVNRRPLPDRLNVVVSKGLDSAPGALVARSLTQALFRAKREGSVENVFVIGGAEIFRMALRHPRFRYCYLTRVNGEFDCDTRLEDLEQLLETDAGWADAADHEDNGFEYRIERRRRRSPI